MHVIQVHNSPFNRVEERSSPVRYSPKMGSTLLQNWSALSWLILVRYSREVILRIILRQQQTKGIVSLTHCKWRCSLAANIRILFSLLPAAVSTLLGRPMIRDMGSISILIWKFLSFSHIILTRNSALKFSSQFYNWDGEWLEKCLCWGDIYIYGLCKFQSCIALIGVHIRLFFCDTTVQSLNNVLWIRPLWLQQVALWPEGTGGR